MGTDTFHWIRLLQALSDLPLDTSRDREATTILDSLCQFPSDAVTKDFPPWSYTSWHLTHNLPHSLSIACFPLPSPRLLSPRDSNNSPEKRLEKGLFTAAWRVLPLPAGGCWFCPQTPAWRAGCPAGPAAGPSLPVAIWIWATWTCDKKQKPWWGGRPSLTNK